MKVTIAKALKLKNRQAQQVTKLQGTIASGNSRLVGSVASFDLRETLKQLHIEADRLVEIKRAISLANQPIQGDIYRIAELKGEVAMWRRTETTQGRHMLAYLSQEPQEYEVTFSEAETEGFIQRLESEIDDLQDRLDTHNATTQVELPD